MYKLGILGTCNTHAVIFSSLFNKPGCDGSGFYGYGRAKVEYIFGYDAISVNSFERNGTLTSVLGYDKYNIALNFIPDANYNYCAVFTNKDIIVKDIDISLVFKEQMRQFIQMLETGVKPQDLLCLYKSVKVVNAIIESYEKKREIIIKD
jgi:hypothetical protein